MCLLCSRARHPEAMVRRQRGRGKRARLLRCQGPACRRGGRFRALQQGEAVPHGGAPSDKALPVVSAVFKTQWGGGVQGGRVGGGGAGWVECAGPGSMGKGKKCRKTWAWRGWGRHALDLPVGAAGLVAAVPHRQHTMVQGLAAAVHDPCRAAPHPPTEASQPHAWHPLAAGGKRDPSLFHLAAARTCHGRHSNHQGRIYATRERGQGVVGS